MSLFSVPMWGCLPGWGLMVLWVRLQWTGSLSLGAPPVWMAAFSCRRDGTSGSHSTHRRTSWTLSLSGKRDISINDTISEHFFKKLSGLVNVDVDFFLLDTGIKRRFKCIKWEGNGITEVFLHILADNVSS